MDEILSLPVIDGHCHPFDPDRPPPADQWLQFEPPARGPGADTLLRTAAAHLYDLAGRPADLLDHAGIVGQVVDFGWPDLPLTPADYRDRVGLPVKPLIRLEALCEQALASGERDVRGLADLVAEAVSAALESGPWAGLKSVAAYETGLAIGPVAWAEAQDALDRGAPRSQSPALNNWLLLAGLRRAAELGAVVQFHTGIGSRFLPAEHVSPWPLAGLLEQDWMAGARVVLLHAGYPHVTEAGRLCSGFANVFVDISILFPFAFPAHISRFQELLAFAAPGRVTFGSDGCFEPERYWIAALLAKQALSHICGGMVRNGYMTPGAALGLARAILHDTARNLYGFGGTPA